MAEEILEQQQEQLGMEQDYLDTIQQLKQNTVSREDYDKLKGENQKLLAAVINGDTIEQAAAVPEKPRMDEIKELYADIFVKGEHSNLKFHEKMYRLCDLIEEETGQNPMVPWGFNGESPATDADYAVVKRDRENTEAIMAYAEGNSQVFTDQLQLRTNDNSPIPQKGARRR